MIRATIIIILMIIIIMVMSVCTIINIKITRQLTGKKKYFRHVFP